MIKIPGCVPSDRNVILSGQKLPAFVPAVALGLGEQVLTVAAPTSSPLPRKPATRIEDAALNIVDKREEEKYKCENGDD